MTESYSIDNHEIIPVIIDGIAYVKEATIAKCLGVDHRRLSDVFAAHQQDFTLGRTRLLEVCTAEGTAMVRLYSATGAATLAKLVGGHRATAFADRIKEELKEAAAEAARGQPADDDHADACFARGYDSLSAVIELMYVAGSERGYNEDVDLMSVGLLLDLVRRQFAVTRRAMFA